MKIVIEMNEKSELLVTSDDDPLDVADASLLLDLGKMYIQSEWLRSVEEKNKAQTEPEILSDEQTQ